MSGTAVGTSRVLLHGTIPVPGVWHWEGKASRNDVNGPAWRKSQIGINYEASVGNDFMASGTFFSNSGATTQSATRPKELHLQANLVPRAHDREHDVRTSEGGSLEPQWRHSSDMSTLGTYSPASPSLSPSRRVSAIRIEDATSWAASPTGASATSASPTGASASLHASPQRMFVNGQWRLESSLHPSKSSPEFSSHSRQIANTSSTVGKHFPPRLDHKQYMADNWRLGEAHDERLRLEVRRKQDGELSALSEWGGKWGHEATPHRNDSPSRRKRSQVRDQPTLTGYYGPGTLPGTLESSRSSLLVSRSSLGNTDPWH